MSGVRRKYTLSTISKTCFVFISIFIFDFVNNMLCWCMTCQSWRNSLENEHVFPERIRWNKTESWTWPHAADNICQVFVNPSNPRFNLRDISTLCHIWKNCTRFTLRPGICEKTLEKRNEYYGHNPDRRVSDVQKAVVFDVLKDLVNDGDFKLHIDAQKCREYLSKIETEEPLKQSLSRLFRETQTIRTNTEANNEMTRRIILEQQKNSKIDQTKEILGSVPEIVRGFVDRMFNRGTLFFSLIIIISSIVLFRGQEDKHVLDNFSGCVSEQYRYPYPQDLPLINYLEVRVPFVGRDWLFDELDGNMSNPDQSSNGILLQAEMGYGKSAIIRHILCASEESIAGQLRKHVVAFHICKFDVPSTWKIERFISRLIGFFSSQSAEFGSAISMLDKYSLIYSQDACAKEPIACFDQGIVSSLKKINPETQWIVAIDALDECFNPETNKNDILDLISTRLRYFPPWIKFIITTRENYKNNVLKGLDRIYLNSSDQRNVHDIELFIDSHSEFLQKRDSLPAESLREKFKSNVLGQAEGNFLFIIHALEYAMTRSLDSYINFPTTLGDIYEINLQRKFPTPSSFRIARLILQIVCTSLHPMDKSDVSNVLVTTKQTEEKNVKESLKKLSSFLKYGDKLRILHQSLKEWLLDESNVLFHISKEEGHDLLAKYLIQSLHANISVDIVDLAIHISQSGNASHELIFKSLQQSLPKRPTLAHELVMKSNSVKALKLLLPFIPDVNILDSEGYSSYFIAAKKGHKAQLKVLVAKGANLNFTVKDAHFYPEFIYNLSSLMHLNDECEQSYFCGYSLLHIAAKFGHVHIVKYLLRKEPNLVHGLSTVGLNFVDVACESGKLNVIEITFQYKKYRNLLGEMCVYLAAKYGHEHVIDFLIKEKEFSFDCINDTLAYQTYNKEIATLKVFERVPTRRDIWWVIFQESPLHVAVRYNRLAIVSKMFKTNPNMLGCHDAFGKSPFLSSVWYNLTGIFEFLARKIRFDTERCLAEPLPYIDLLKNNMVFRNYIEDNQCPTGLSFPHIAAKFDRIDMVKYAVKRRLKVNWSAVDLSGNPPDHYAASAGSKDYLYMAMMGHLSHNLDDSRSSNGSTVYHVAALSAQVSSFSILIYNRIPQFVDLDKRSVLQYLAMQNLIDTDFKGQSDIVRIFNTLIHHGHDLLHVDIYNRNILHYALANGHYHMIGHIYHAHQESWSKLITQPDSAGLTPVLYAMMHNNQSSSEYSNAIDCFVLISCDPLNYRVHMASWETAALEILKRNQLDVRIPQKYLPHLFRISPMLTKGILVYQTSMKTNFKDAIMKLFRQRNPKNNNEVYSLASLLVHKPNIFQICNRAFDNSPLHNVFMFYQGPVLTRILVSFLGSNEDKWSKYFSCPDKRGYNAFHYAIFGGNVETADILLNFNIDVSNTKVQYRDIPYMVLRSPLREPNCKYLLSKHCLAETDKFLSRYVRNFATHLSTSVFCESTSQNFSLVHILAYYHLENTLKALGDTNGLGVLSCKNKDGFTPQYMWRLNLENEGWEKIINGNMNLEYPDIEAEAIFLFKLFNHFPFAKRSLHTHRCLFKWTREKWYNINRMKLHRIRHCRKHTLNAVMGATFSHLIVFLDIYSEFIESNLNILEVFSQTVFEYSKNGLGNTFVSYLETLGHFVKKLMFISRIRMPRTAQRLFRFKRQILRYKQKVKNGIHLSLIKGFKRTIYLNMYILGEINSYIMAKLILHITINGSPNRNHHSLKYSSFFHQRRAKSNELIISNPGLDLLSAYPKYNYQDIIERTFAYKNDFSDLYRKLRSLNRKEFKITRLWFKKEIIQSIGLQ